MKWEVSYSYTLVAQKIVYW